MELKLNELIKSIIANGGATIDQKGNIKKLNTGYMVSIKGKELQVPKDNIKALRIALKCYILDTPKPYYIGAWVDNGIVYIDNSLRVTTKKEALKIAKENEQLAIYDNKGATSIYMM